MTIEPGFMRRIAAAAAEETLPRFRQSGLVDNKLTSGFDPVTEADRMAEQAIRALIRATYPEHGIHGEEFGLENESARYQWVIDPIDGTRSFISGMPLWGTLVGLTDNGDAVAGMMSQPFIGELFWCDGKNSHYEGPHGSKQIATSKVVDVADATLCTTTPSMFTGERKVAYDRLESAVKLARYGTDCYAYAMLAAGNVDLVVETGLQPYDIIALIPIIEQAGGVITTWDGGPAEQAGDIVAAATPELHAAAVKLLQG
ncbi:histidinol-phosphatase [Aerobium aerolatum]|uniref:Histidinol-phosphatase n=1 Tax=Aquamicrobium aerolatum DSM 21857 TaxID=1121003 RepID=A0A1I3MTU5_9HYPH|nr:histidinol-phosphatase [Aquamicrobium aerolatum]SFJ00210.1 histidinol-phosphatase, inositol monophosphatase family [Aquamicrobium aerolatum DSM 21857]